MDRYGQILNRLNEKSKLQNVTYNVSQDLKHVVKNKQTKNHVADTTKIIIVVGLLQEGEGVEEERWDSLLLVKSYSFQAKGGFEVN